MLRLFFDNLRHLDNHRHAPAGFANWLLPVSYSKQQQKTPTESLPVFGSPRVIIGWLFSSLQHPSFVLRRSSGDVGNLRPGLRTSSEFILRRSSGDVGNLRLTFVSLRRLILSCQSLSARKTDFKIFRRNSGGIPAEFRIPDFSAYQANQMGWRNMICIKMSYQAGDEMKTHR